MTSIKQRVRVEDNRAVRASLRDNKDWMKIYAEKA